jgi:hypothetical protein
LAPSDQEEEAERGDREVAAREVAERDAEDAAVLPHPRSDARQSQNSISRIIGGIDAKSGFYLPER